MQRKIIRIDRQRCNGCGLCAEGCPEGAIKIIDGKAEVVNEFFCDGLGACIGTCPEGAISIEEREAQPYNEREVIKNIARQGMEFIKNHLHHLKEHDQLEYLKEALEFLKEKNMKVPMDEPLPVPACGCPGSKTIDLRHAPKESNVPAGELNPELQNWPIQLQLVNPNAPYFKNAELVIAADCAPFAYPDFHRRLLKGKLLIIFCPKLDKTLDLYIDKLTEIIKNNNIKSISVVHMEVPCCFGLVKIVKEAVKVSQMPVTVKEYTVSIKGNIINPIPGNV